MPRPDAEQNEIHGQTNRLTMLTNKDLADELGCSTVTLKRRRFKLGLKPTFFNGCKHRWSRSDADRFILRWSTFTKKNVKQPSQTVGAGTGNSLLEKAKGNRRHGQRAGNRAVHRAADGKRVAASQRIGARASNS